jgi:predicted peroxiredoxin
MRKNSRRLVAVTAALVLSTVGFFTIVAKPTPQTSSAIEHHENPQRILINLKHYTDDLHAAMMALKIANGLQNHGAKVTIFVNLEGVRLVDKGTPGNLQWGTSEATPSALLSSFLGAGGTVLVCPHCAEAAGIGPDDLRPGATISDHDATMLLFLEADKVIDY